MNEDRPKLLLLDSPNVPGLELSRILAEHYRTIIASPETVGQTSGLSDCQAILCGVDDFPPLSRALAPSESSAVLAAMGQGVCMTSSDGNVVWANDRFRSFDEGTKSRIASVCKRAAQQLAEQLIEQDISAFSSSLRFEVASPDDTRFYEVSVAPVGKPSTAGIEPRGPIDRFVAVAWDVTQARRYQQKMDAIDRAGEELVRLDAQHISRLHVSERLKLLEEKIIRFSHELLNFDHLAIRLIDEPTGRLELVIAKGMSREATEIELYAQREGNGIMGYVASTGRSYISPDVTKDRRYVIGLANARSSLTVPLRLHDKVIGAFNVESEQLAAFTEEDRQFAEMFARHVALALHILDLLVVERCATGQSVTGTVQGELSEPLEDIVREADWLRREAGQMDPKLREHIDRIMADVEAIRARNREAAEGPQSILGAEKMIIDAIVDPVMAGRRVLVADDQPKIRQLIKDVLKGKGCRVVVCSDGGAAIAEIERAAKLGQRFDLIISDIKMPDRNGYEVFASAKRADESIPVILMTGFGYDPHHSIVRASQEGLQCVLFKPFQCERLVDEARRALAERSLPAGNAAN